MSVYFHFFLSSRTKIVTMQRKVYFLSTCDTSRRIMKEVGVDDSFEQQDIKFNPVTEEQIEHFYRQTGSYEETSEPY